MSNKESETGEGRFALVDQAAARMGPDRPRVLRRCEWCGDAFLVRSPEARVCGATCEWLARNFRRIQP